jgi:type IV pilus assembly protein PilB
LHDPDVPALLKLGLTEAEIRAAKFYQPIGCSECIKGYRGRTAIHEALYFTKEIRQLILDAGSSVNEEAIRQAALRNGMRTLRVNALELLTKGITTLEEVANITADDE